MTKREFYFVGEEGGSKHLNTCLRCLNQVVETELEVECGFSFSDPRAPSVMPQLSH